MAAPWRIFRFNQRTPPTRYAALKWDGVDAIQATADASMALLMRSIQIDLVATPVLCWRWRVDDVVHAADMTKRTGDDYAARVYVAFTLPPEALSFAVRTKLRLARSLFGQDVPDAGINYVWDNTHAQGSRVANAFTDRVQMVVQRSGNAQASSWVQERVNVRADALRHFGGAQPTAALLAFGTDTDNTGGQARAGFADFHFVGPNARCEFPAAH